MGKEIRNKTEEILKITVRPNQSGRTKKHKHSKKKSQATSIKEDIAYYQ